jgi:demethylmenaquinone methyltransferase / 2-methoxy-6-polyprenyl-1,4-benzoquinol methylase
MRKQHSVKNSQHVEQMFDDIAQDYDRLNHILTLGIDKRWRKKLVRMIMPLSNKKVLDIATGTGDLAFSMLKYKPELIQGVDFSHKMVELCNLKIKKKNAGHIFKCLHGDVMNLPFEKNTFDIACIAFGIRNFEDTGKALTEIRRVLCPGGQLIVLEFFRSKLVEKNRFYRFYMKQIMPKIGKMISGHSWAYNYLFESTENFMSETEFVELLKLKGFEQIQTRNLMRGMAFIIKGNAAAVY